MKKISKEEKPESIKNLNESLQKPLKSVEKWADEETIQTLNKSWKMVDIEVEGKNHAMHVIDVAPSTSLESKERSEEVPTLLIPGFQATSLSFTKNIVGLSKKGRRVLSLYSPHGVSLKHEDIPQLRQAVAIVHTLDAMSVSKVNIVAHSQGAVIATLVAMLRPDMVQSMVLASPAGMTGKESVVGLMHKALSELSAQRKIGKHLPEEEKQAFQQRHAIQIHEGIHYWKDSIFQSVKELRSLTKTEIHEVLRLLQEKYDIQVGVLMGNDDKLFPKEKMQPFISKAGVNEENVYVLPGTHGTHIEYPDELTDAAHAMLTHFEHGKKLPETIQLDGKEVSRYSVSA